MEFDPQEQDRIEERLFALREMARKHGVSVDDLSALCERKSAQLAMLDDSDAELTKLAAAEQKARDSYQTVAEKLSKARAKAGAGLDTSVMAELAPLKLEKAVFKTRVVPLEEREWGAKGIDDVAFEVATNPGTAPGPIAKIASGGELSRFMLALKVVLAGLSETPTLVFDEVDSGIGGATADAVGERLGRLASARQVLVVTHSPQVAARGVHHLTVVKSDDDRGTAGTRGGMSDVTRTHVMPLAPPARQEEIARMLSGTEITSEARAQANRLLENAAAARASFDQEIKNTKKAERQHRKSERPAEGMLI